jgi:Raf kinase inhibitor-like YbhB/YbcL family protein
VNGRVAALAGALLAGCGSANPPARPPAPIAVWSPAFSAGATIPRRYTCDGSDISPPLRISGTPRSATALALTMRDPDAPGGNFIHWRLTHIPPATTLIPAGRLPAGAVPGTNGYGTVGYRGPCPPRGAGAHHYLITVLALARGRVIARGELIGTYARR